MQLHCAAFLLCAWRFKAGDAVEGLLVDAAPAQTMKCPIEVLWFICLRKVVRRWNYVNANSPWG
jgi:hypothetical protein